MEKPKLAVIIGRFQPLHNGHLPLFKTALDLVGGNGKVVVLLGSANQPRTPYNPFTWEERADIIEKWIMNELKPNSYWVGYYPLNDYKYNDGDWIEEVQRIVDSVNKDNKYETFLVGHHKDNSSYYLDIFPQWKDVVEVPAFDESLSATIIREAYFEIQYGDLIQVKFKNKVQVSSEPVCINIIEDRVPKSTFKFLNEFANRPGETLNNLVNEFLYYEEYPSQWGNGPFVTVDAAVFCCGHILLIRRKTIPGQGLYALPGGFLNNDEFIATGIVRELEEETRIKVPTPALHGNMKHIELFDHPKRSLRGRVITHCGLINLRNDKKLPEVRGADDADKAVWVPTSEFTDKFREKMFEDHYDMVIRMKSLLK